MSVMVSTEDVIRAMDDAGISHDALHEHYSGRAMYGDTCLGLVCSVGEVFLFCAALGSFADDWDWVGNARSDDMGRNTIWYWPEVKVTEEEDE